MSKVDAVSLTISILAFGLSLFTLIWEVMKNRKNVEITVSELSRSHNDFQYAMIDIVNKSEKNIVISNVYIEKSEHKYSVSRKPKLYLSTKKTVGTEVVEHKDYFTATLPLTVNGVDCRTECFELHIADQPSLSGGKVNVVMSTNKGRVKKSVVLPPCTNNFNF